MDFRLEIHPAQPRDYAGRWVKVEDATLAVRRSVFEGGLRALVKLERDEAPSNTGKFKAGIRHQIEMRGKTIMIGYTTAPEPLATFIKGGTRPHDIMPQRGNVLAFFWKDGPQGPATYFFPKVHHPGTRANPYHERALRRWNPIAQDVLKKMSKATLAYVFQ